MKQKRDVHYGTIQIRELVKRQIVDYCDKRGLKIGKYMELLFLYDVSGSSSGSITLR
jgi:hypothetical protein